MPNCPKSLAPQQIKSSSSNSAQVCPAPASIITALRPDGNDREGSMSPVSKYPSPKPSSLADIPKPKAATLPQHFIELSSNNAQLCSSPRAREIGISPVPKSKNGRLIPISPDSSPMSRILPIPS